MALYTLVYVSTQTADMTNDALTELLTVSRRNNSRDAITGMLLHRSGNFIQVLEGEEQTVKDLHRKIERDSRHKSLITLLQRPLDQRYFEEWSMGFRHLDEVTINIPGFSQIMNSPYIARSYFADPGVSQQLLLSFKQNMR